MGGIIDFESLTISSDVMSQTLRLSRLYDITGNVTDTTLIVVYFESRQFEKFASAALILT